MERVKNSFFLFVGLVLVAGSFVFVLNQDAPTKYQKENPYIIVQIGRGEIVVEVADTDESRARGLSGRQSLGEDEGLLFVFETIGNHGFWMKEMHFPIDIIWLDEEKKVVHIESGVKPETFPRVFYPSYPAKYVLEVVNARSFDLGIDIGTQAFFNL
jgi:uncharacterized protein